MTSRPGWGNRQGNNVVRSDLFSNEINNWARRFDLHQRVDGVVLGGRQDRRPGERVFEAERVPELVQQHLDSLCPGGRGAGDRRLLDAVQVNPGVGGVGHDVGAAVGVARLPAAQPGLTRVEQVARRENPGVALMVLIVAINLVGDRIRDQLNPKLKR